MIWSLASLSLPAASLATSLLLGGALAAQAPPAAPQSGWMQTFSGGLKRLGLLFSNIGSLASGPSAGEVWSFDKKTGQRRRIGAQADLAWPVPSPDGQFIYALRGRQPVRIAFSDGREAPVGEPVGWRKLLGVDPEDGAALGFVDDEPFPRPALLRKDGERIDLPPPADDAARKQIGILLQESRSYADGTRLEVQDSERGGRGRDVFLIEGAQEQNLSDCGDDVCGQPARSMDGTVFFYVRSARR